MEGMKKTPFLHTGKNGVFFIPSIRSRTLRRAGATLFATLCGCLAFAAGLWAFVAFATARFREDAVLLHFAGEPLERHLK